MFFVFKRGMLKTLKIVLFLLAPFYLLSQPPVKDGINIKIDSVSTNDTSVFDVTTTPPLYKGQTTYLQMLNDLKQNFIFSSKILTVKKEGKVFIEFVIDKKGHLSRFKVLKSLHPIIDNEIMSSIKKTEGFWHCAKIYDVDVNSRFVFPFIYKIPETIEFPKLKDSIINQVQFYYKTFVYPLPSFKKTHGTLIFKAIINQDETIQVTNIIKHTLPPFEKEFLRIVSQTQWKPLKINGELRKCEVLIKIDYRTSRFFPKYTFVSIEKMDCK